jgi:hypothetical protein
MTKQATRALHAGINCYLASDTRIGRVAIASDHLCAKSSRDEIDALPAILSGSNLGDAPPSLFVRFKLEDRFDVG